MSLCHRFVIPTIGEDWRFLARELFPSISQADKAIDAIENKQRRGDLKEKALRATTRWQQECAQGASYSVLLTALSHIARNDIVHKFNIDDQDVKDAEDSVIDIAKKDYLSRIKAATKRAVMLTSMELQMKHWRFLYRYLSREQDDEAFEAKIATIDVENEEVREKIITMLITWIREEGEVATFRTLIETLDSDKMKLRDIAAKLRDVCQRYGVDLTASGDQQRLVL